MKNRELIYQSLRLIEKNLKSDLSVYDVSQELGFSFYYFSRLFKGITGISPKAYILHRKTSESVNDVLGTDKKLLDIALDYGFSSSESFSRAFNRIIGQNPSELRKEGKLDRYKLLPPMTKERIERNQYLHHQEPEVCELGPIHLVGLPFYYSSCEVKDLSTQWSYLTDNFSAIQDMITPIKHYQVQYWFPQQDTESLFFFVAVAVNSFQDIPIQFTAKTIPRLHYLKFEHRGLSNKVGYTYQFIYERYLPDTSNKLPYLFNFEHYGDRFKGPYNEDSISEIYIPVEL